MIIKERHAAIPSDLYGKAGYEAEHQMAFYLRRAFGESDEVHVFNDLRLERKGDFAQIDHLVLHRLGFVLIESKSVSDRIEVNEQYEFVRVHGTKRIGMPSPIKQVERQQQILQILLDENKTQLRRTFMFGLRQGGFGDGRFFRFVAISDHGEIIRRFRGNALPELVKADAVTDRIRELIPRPKGIGGIAETVLMAITEKKEVRKPEQEHLTPFTEDEFRRISEFLRSSHSELAGKSVQSSLPSVKLSSTDSVGSTQSPKERPQTPPQAMSFRTPTPEPSKEPVALCKHCNSRQVEIVYGKYGYYFKCMDCGGNTKISVACRRCSAKAKISKSSLEFKAVCDACGYEEHFHTNLST